jgi:LppX_LprAFG lipoprotein
MRGNRIAFGLALLVSAAALAGCGVARTVDPVAAAASKTQAAGGAKMSLTAAVTTPDGRSFDLSANGTFDQQEGDVTVDASKALSAAGLSASNGQVELRYLEENGDPVLYANLPFLADKLPGGKAWIRLDVQQAGQKLGIDFGQLFSQAGQNPGQILDLLRASGSVETIGPETVDGASTTHYKATIELDKVAGEVGGAVGQALYDRLSSQGAPSSIPVDVWVGDDGLVRRVALDETVASGGQSAGVKLQLDVSDYGTPVTVTAPPSDQVLDLTGLVSGLTHA